jgi:uncharacterized membrane protein
VIIRRFRAQPKRGEALLLVCSAAAALTPKCPLCLFALLGATGAAGAAAATWMPRLLVASLLHSVVAVCMRAQRERRYGAAIVAVLVAIAMLTGRFVFHSTAVVVTGAAALFAIAVVHFATERIRCHKPLAH